MKTGDRVYVMHYGTRSGVIVRVTRTRVLVRIAMTGREDERWFRQANRVEWRRGVARLGEWCLA